MARTEHQVVLMVAPGYALLKGGGSEDFFTFLSLSTQLLCCLTPAALTTLYQLQILKRRQPIVASHSPPN